MKEDAAKTPSKPAVVSLAQLLAEQPASPPPGWIEPGLLPPQGILFVGGEPKVGKSLLVANLALALAAGKIAPASPSPPRAGFWSVSSNCPRRSLWGAWHRCADPWEPPPTKTCWWTRGPAAIC